MTTFIMIPTSDWSQDQDRELRRKQPNTDTRDILGHSAGAAGLAAVVIEKKNQIDEHVITRELQHDDRSQLGQVPLQTTRDLRIQIAANQIRRIATTSSLQHSPLANSLVHGLSCATC